MWARSATVGTGQRTPLRSDGPLTREFQYRRGDWRSEQIAAAGDGPNQLLRIIVQSPPDFHQTLRQRIFRDRRIRPDRVHQGGLGYHVAVVIHQVDQDVERLRPQRNFFIAAPKSSTVHVQREIAKRVLAAEPFSRMWLRAAQPIPSITSLDSNGTFIEYDDIFSSLYHAAFNTSDAFARYAAAHQANALNIKEQQYEKYHEDRPCWRTGLVLLAGLTGIVRGVSSKPMNPDAAHVISFDLAIDCRTAVERV